MQKSKSLLIFSMLTLVAFSGIPSVFGALTPAELEEALVQVRIDRANIQLEADEALQLIEYANQVGQPFDKGEVVLKVSGMHQGKNQNFPALDSKSWLEIILQYQDGTETITTQQIDSTFQIFRAFDNTPLFSFAPTSIDPLRTVVRVDIIPVTDFSGIGSKWCFDFTRNTVKDTVKLNGNLIDTDISGTTGIEGFNEATQIYRGSGVSFTPELTERLLGFDGIELKTGDKLTWEVTNHNRFTAWDGFLEEDPDPRTGEFSCNVTGEFAFDVYATGMLFNMELTYVDPLDRLLIQDNTGADSDGDGISDLNDQCDFSRETYNGFEDTDGCPDEAPPVVLTITSEDRDGDGLVDASDSCPTQPETFNNFEDNDGCPDVAPPDNDGDGIPNSLDQCVSVPENFNGIQDDDGCPDGTTISGGGFGQEPDVNLTPNLQGDIGELPNLEQLIESLVEEEPESNFHAGDDDVTGESGQTNECDNLTENCIVIIEQAVQEFEQRTGINIPFPLTTVNIIIFFAGLTLAIVFVLKVFKKI